jgi:hypothetical protein
MKRMLVISLAVLCGCAASRAPSVSGLPDIQMDDLLAHATRHEGQTVQTVGVLQYGARSAHLFQSLEALRASDYAAALEIVVPNGWSMRREDFGDLSQVRLVGEFRSRSAGAVTVDAEQVAGTIRVISVSVLQQFPLRELKPGPFMAAFDVGIQNQFQSLLIAIESKSEDRVVAALGEMPSERVEWLRSLLRDNTRVRWVVWDSPASIRQFITNSGSAKNLRIHEFTAEKPTTRGAICACPIDARKMCAPSVLGIGVTGVLRGEHEGFCLRTDLDSQRRRIFMDADLIF